MLKFAVKGRVPLIHLKMDDTVYAHDILKEICGHEFKRWPEGEELETDTAYYHVSRTGIGLDNTRAAYVAMQSKGSCLVYINIQKVPSEYLDIGHVSPPVSLLKKMLAVAVNKEMVDTTAAALGGLSIKDALNAVRVTRARDSKLSLEGIVLTRRLMLQESRGLTMVDPYMPAYLPDAKLKAWADKEKKFFLLGDSRLRPRGILLDGPAGTGKTQGAKYLATQWGVPLYRLGATFLHKYIGDSESNFEVALKQAEAAQPCVLLIDEIEKFFSGSGNESTGTMGRVMGSLLWWLQEHDARVITVMTTNRKESIPPELYREGRIDKVFMFSRLQGSAALEVAEVVFKSYVDASFPPDLSDAILKAASIPQYLTGTKVIDEQASPVGISHTKVAAMVRDYVKNHHGPEQ